jgi:hypothetical protein
VMVAGTTTVDVPEQGQLVEVRRRRYVVTNVVGNTHPTSPLSGDGKPQHLIARTFTEDGTLGEKLQVKWDLLKSFPKPEHKQYDCGVATLEARVGQIPGTIEQETALIAPATPIHSPAFFQQRSRF